MKKTIVILLGLLSTKGFSQSNGTTFPLLVSGYLETYYAYDYNKPSNHNRPSFLYSYNRHNEVNLNLGYIKIAHQSDGIRSNLALATGTYMNANYANEPGILKNIYEANIGIKLSKQHNLWIDAGMFSSHIGFESAVGKDNWALTRSMSADNSPYYESGTKITYITANDKWLFSGLILNGWQRIQRVSGNNSLSFGHQVMFKPNSKITLNSSSFIGSDQPDSTKKMRYFHNLYGIFQLSKHLAVTAGFDIGAEQTVKGSNKYNTWYNPTLIAKYSPNMQHCIVARVECYQDRNGVIVNTGTANGFETWGYSLNYDYYIKNNVVWRIEGRKLSSKDKIFTRDGAIANNNFALTTSLAISF